MRDLTSTTLDAPQVGHGQATAPTVLLVEDDRKLSLFVSGLLDEAGYRTVTIADHGQIGAAVESWQPRCVIIDGALLPAGQERSWSDAIAIRRAHPDLPLLMFTADAAALTEARAGTSGRSRAAGFAGVVGKPFVLEELLATVRGVVDAPPPAVAPSGAPSDDRILASTLSSGAASRPVEDLAPVAWVSAIVHELRSPLTTISGQIQLARRNMVRNRPAQQGIALDRALVQVARMERVISELLDRSRMDAGTVRLEVVAFDLCAVVADIVAQHERDAGQQVAFDPATPDVRVRGDPFRVAQIVDNLVNNSVKYGRAGSRIDVSLRVVGSEAQLRVEDHGVGVPPDEQGRLFERYYRSTRTRAVPGTGLGLHISRRLAELHGGRLWLERSTEAGSVFALALPIADS